MTTPTNRTLTEVIIADVRYLRSTRNANPVFQVTLADGRTWPTKADANVNYQVQNFDSEATDFGELVDVTLDEHDEITRVVLSGGK